MDIRWFTLDDPVMATRAHGYTDGATRSLCSQASLPLDFVEDLVGGTPRCGNCQRVAVRNLTAEQAAADGGTDRWRQVATCAVLGDGWSYEETAQMPSYRAEVDRVAVALADAFKEGILQGNASVRTGN
jgi:hypothetical protein